MSTRMETHDENSRLAYGYIRNAVLAGGKAAETEWSVWNEGSDHGRRPGD